MKYGTVLHWRLFRIYVFLFQERYKLVVQLRFLIEMCVYSTTVSIILSICSMYVGNEVEGKVHSGTGREGPEGE
jgi:hypothetical protein